MDTKTKFRVGEEVVFESGYPLVYLNTGTIIRITMTIYEKSRSVTYHIRSNEGIWLSRVERKVLKKLN